MDHFDKKNSGQSSNSENAENKSGNPENEEKPSDPVVTPEAQAVIQVHAPTAYQKQFEQVSLLKHLV
jgi:hypothetical protein